MPWPFTRKTVTVLTDDASETSPSASRRFAFKLFRELSRGDSANVFFSPASVMLNLAMVHELASGETRRAMAEALEVLDLSPGKVEDEVALLKSSLRARPLAEVTFANAIWLGIHARIAPALAERLSCLYESELGALDANSVTTINNWVHEKTKGKIPKIVDQISPLSALVALNAVYFKGAWLVPFRRELTQERPFTTSGGETKHVPSMPQSSTYVYYEDSQLQMAALPYKGGLSMYVVLPAEGTDSQKFTSAMCSGLWDSWCARAGRMEGTILLPRFKLETDAQLNSALTALGMSRAFDQDQAEFGNIETDQPPVWIDRVVHRALVDVNEEGTVAAAATMSAMFCGSAMAPKPKPHFRMIVNRPFLVAICDDSTKAILFLGWVGDPQA